MAEPVVLETARLRLRQWRADDRQPFAAMSADPEVMAWFPAPLSADESAQLAERCAALIDERGWGFWAVEEKSAAAFIGCVGLHVPAPELPFSPCVEIGWRLDRPYWGRGLAHEAAQAALDFGFQRLGLPEIVAFTTLGNRRSQSLMQRLDMRPAGEFDHPQLPAGHPLLRHCLYRLARADFLTREKLA